MKRSWLRTLQFLLHNGNGVLSLPGLMRRRGSNKVAPAPPETSSLPQKSTSDATQEAFAVTKEYRQRWGQDAFQSLSSVAFREADADGSGLIDRAELKATLGKVRVNIPDAQVAEIFDKYDKDNSGFISEEEWHTLLGDLLDGKLTLNGGEKRANGRTPHETGLKTSASANSLTLEAKLRCLLAEHSEVSSNEFLKKCQSAAASASKAAAAGGAAAASSAKQQKALPPPPMLPEFAAIHGELSTALEAHHIDRSRQHSLPPALEKFPTILKEPSVKAAAAQLDTLELAVANNPTDERALKALRDQLTVCEKATVAAIDRRLLAPGTLPACENVSAAAQLEAARRSSRRFPWTLCC